MPKPEKTRAVEDITGRFQESTAALLTEYRGLSVSNIGEVRNALREVDADYKVLKNTLARIAARDVGMEDLVGMLEGPTAIAFCRGDAVAAAKALDDAARKYPVLVIKGGILRGKVIDADQARALASLEPREVQLAKIAMLMNTPLQQTVNVFAALLRDLGSMLAQVLSKKESGELPSGDGAAAGAPQAQPAAPEAATPDEIGDRGASEVAEVAADTESDTSGDAVESVAAPSEAAGDESTDTEAAAGGGDQKEEE